LAGGDEAKGVRFTASGIHGLILPHSEGGHMQRVGHRFFCFILFVALFHGLLAGQLHAQTNGILREVYSGIAGGTIFSLTNSPDFPNNPSSRTILSSFEAPTDVGDNYGQRLSAWITPPTTGNYLFWIAGDDNCLLYLSTNSSPANKVAIASVPDWTNPREWTKYSQQVSAPIPLIGGQRYYIEALMKEGGGGDNLAVRWRLPNNVIEEPIPGSRLGVIRIGKPDSVTLRPGGKVRFYVTPNDEGTFSNVVEIASSPAFGTAVANNDGTVLYSHTIGSPTSDAFAYRLIGAGGPPSSNVTVNVNFTTAARLTTDFVKMPASAPSASWRMVDAFPGLTFNTPNSMCAAPGISNALFLVECAGRIWMVTNLATTPTKVLYLDITNRVLSDAFERGAKGVACHPGFKTNGLMFVTYNYTSGGINYVRLSKFTNSNPASEVVLIQQVDDGPFHDIDTCRFGPDGYLYVSIGDEGGQEEQYQNAQRIDKDLYSCIIRIDVDKKPGNLEPNADVDIPRDGLGKAYFSVPSNNPFVGATSFNGRPVNSSQVRTEIYVLGLRNPWQFSFAPGTNKLWVADVGREAREEIDLLGPGQNAGWSWREASLPGPRSGQTINEAAESAAVLATPVLEYSHGSGTNQGYSITGGFVYQGTNYPGLNGLYIFADFISGHIWTMNPTNPVATFNRITGQSSLSAFLLDPSNNDILAIQWSAGDDSGRILRLVFNVDDSPFPQTLSATGFFADLSDLTPNPGAEAYAPNLPFWSDYATKRRWFLIKNTTDTLTYSRDGKWTFPTGMIWAKHFDLELQRGNPATRKRIETRMLVKTASGAYGVTYKWNAAGNEAFLVQDAGEEFDLSVTNNGIAATQRYHIPSRSECVTCHNPQAGSVLSFNTRQLNCNGTIAGFSTNLLTGLMAAGYLVGLNENPTVLPRYVRPDETQYSVESRARSYLAVNCAYCHQPGGSGPPSWNGRPELSLWDTGLINGIPLAGANPSHRLILPGDLNQSIVWNRVARTNGYTQMPPIGTNEKDTVAIQLLADWILNTLPSRQNYDSWRLAYFGSLTTPQGERGADPDGDGVSNEGEYLQYSNPAQATDFYSQRIVVTNSQVAVELPNFIGRRVTVQTSTDLGIADPWKVWQVPGNNGLSYAVGQTNVLSAPITNPMQFFRIRFQEE
jgi:glucose/arabinose dehydrogenase/mono/diheme cytochrome c family protein